MLHLIFQSPIELAVLKRIGRKDHVVFYENAVFQVYKDSRLTKQIELLFENDVLLYVLAEELEIRGLTRKNLITGIKVINYLELVDLTLKNRVIRTWN